MACAQAQPSRLLGCSPAGWQAIRPFAAAPQTICRRQRRCCPQANGATSGGGSSNGSSGSGTVPSDSSPKQQQQQPRRREILLCSAPWLFLAETVPGMDGRTVLNSLLGAYGLPQLRATPGFRPFDDPEASYTFQFPKAWVARANNRRPGLYIADYQTADKLSLEVFPEPPPGASLAEAAVQKLMFPASEIGGDARLELPPAARIKSEVEEIDGKAYTYISWTSNTTTRSGYEVRRKNLAVAAARRGSIYVLGCSARSDQFNAAKAATFQQIVASFRVFAD